jgi:hypothetical protein
MTIDDHNMFIVEATDHRIKEKERDWRMVGVKDGH